MVALPEVPTVRAMGRMALPLGSRLVAGGLGQGRPVRWARTGGVLSPLFPNINADEVALLDLPQVQGSNPSLTLARVVREFGRLGLSAIVIRGSADAAARREAERSNLPLYELPDGSEIARVARAIIRHVSDREVQEEAQAAALYRHLSQGVAGGLTLGQLIGELHRLSGHAVRLTDLQDNVLAHAGSAPPESQELTRPLFVGESPVAILALRDAAGELDEFSRIALEQGAAALALEMVRLEAVEAAREGVHGNFVTTLLMGEEEGILAARARAAEYPLAATQWVVLALIEASPPAETRLRALLRRAAERAADQGWEARGHLSEAQRATVRDGTLAERHHWQMTLVLGGGEPAWASARATFIDFLRDAWAEPEPLTLAAGEPAPGIGGLQHTLAQANDALALGLRLFGEGGPYLHRGMGLYRLLRHLQGTADLDQFLEQSLAALEQYDAAHESELLLTLRALLDHGGNVSATAKTLHLHRNSVVYRLDRIREISDLDPTNPNDAFALKLALMLAPLR